jgi:hypothetical protein
MKINEILAVDEPEYICDMLRDQVSVLAMNLRNKLANKTADFSIASIDAMSPEYVEEFRTQLSEVEILIQQERSLTEETQTYKILQYLQNYLSGR